jgi:hypothetical protein
MRETCQRATKFGITDAGDLADRTVARRLRQKRENAKNFAFRMSQILHSLLKTVSGKLLQIGVRQVLDEPLQRPVRGGELSDAPTEGKGQATCAVE